MITLTKPRTQSEVDQLIDLCINEAKDYEAKRDAQEHESKRYWFYHDCAIEWHRLAESMMPK